MEFGQVVESRFGRLLLAVDGEGAVTRLLFVHDETEEEALVARGVRLRADGGEEALRQLDEYCAGTRRAFDLRLAPQGTEFQLRVWRELQRIPYGETRTYGSLAATLGGGTVARAVGRANAQNPISIIIPCHRVVGMDGSLTGYAGGLAMKERLLAFEQGRTASLFD